ncbi:hypothetical protein SMD44_03777 [Streptomyces alboflavus]|uniref:Tat pathway signal protein n=1 Tax=Streptomyces alboflavus TaxID=67267 RepID=A0A1Z1WD59_9ACTN|nr:hypothetical protein [Streptomyces alboflavus]ARX84339.1 hypothetical protein SMD44_03777 [Streptomyces alboflavus]
MTGAADVESFKILAADEAKAYDWKTVAALAEPGMPADSWIGNQCVMDRDHVAAVYAPRSFTNKPDLMQGGAFAAIVNTTSGEVTKLPFTASLAYFDPTCNPQTRSAAFTAYRDMNDPATTKTRVVTVDTSGRTTDTTAVDGQVTSAVPVRDGTVAARGRQLVHIDKSGEVKKLTTADSTPFDIRPAARGNIAFADRKDDRTAQAKVFKGHGAPDLVASGRLADVALHQGAGGRVFLTGRPTSTPRLKGSGITRLDVPADADISTHGHLAVDPVLTPGTRVGLDHIANAGKGFKKAERTKRSAPLTLTPQQAADAPVKVTSTATTTGKGVTQSVSDVTAENGKDALTPALGGTGKPRTAAFAAPRAKAAGVSHDPTDPDRWCSISRNDVKMQALQPTPNQVEWAVDMAIRGKLRAGAIRQGEYRNQTGMSKIDPQGLFPPPKLNGGGRIPANVMLGILAQESNLWQAESGVIPGQMGSPLAAVDGYYGHKADEDDPAAFWRIHWDKSDCGYGVGQVTDGMRMAGKEKTDDKGNREQGKAPKLQKAIAVDYASNIAASMYILADKWNEVHKKGQKVTVNNDDPKRVENWFTAAWNYNLGFNPKGAAGKPWGLGWFNNPANPFYPQNRGPFMNTDIDPGANKDAAHPQDWPYEEKVMGWSAWSIDTGNSYSTDGKQDWKGEKGFNSAGFNPAWWTTTANRATVTPPLSTFCNKHNGCDPTKPPKCPDAKCYEKFWWHEENATWKKDCDNTCGNELIKYLTERPEPGRGHRLKYGEPVCTGAPKGASVVASVPNGTETWGRCGPVTSSGSFQFTFYPDSDGHYQAKADLHQVGGGHGGHFWYTHTRDKAHHGGPSGPMTIDGTWSLAEKMDLGKVWVHLPDTGAQAEHANYVIKGVEGGSRTVTVNADSDNTNKWVSLGGYKFTGTPRVSLSNFTHDGTADDDIAWGAVAFQPIKGTYVKDTLEADAFFDEDQNIDVRPESSIFNTPLKSRQDLYDWAMKTSRGVAFLSTCTGPVPDSRCAMRKTRDAVRKWHDEVEKSGTSTTDHPDGHSIPAWMNYSNPYTKRPSTDQRPTWFGKEGGAYKMYNKATVSYIKTSDGKIVDGSQSVTYDDRTADTHLPEFVHEFFKNVSTEYGVPEPKLNYSRKNLNVHDGATTRTTTNSDGILPGLAYQSIGVKPVVTDYDDNPVSGDKGQCVAVMTTAGGSIGYRPALGNDGLTDSVSTWVDKVSDATGSDHPVTKMAAEIRNMFFKPGKTGSIFGTAPPIWQELDFKSCADGSIRKVSGSPVLRSSYMPNQYLYRNGKAIDLDGKDTGSSKPVTTGDFYHFSGVGAGVGPLDKGDPYKECTRSSGHAGNPWSITVLSGVNTDPGAHFCGAPAKKPDVEYTR